MVAVSPTTVVLGLAEQLIVGGSNAFTVIPAVQVAVSHGFIPSLPVLPSFTVPVTVYALLGLQSAGVYQRDCCRCPSRHHLQTPVQLQVAWSFGLSPPAEAVKVTGSPGKIDSGLAVQASVIVCGNAMLPMLHTRPANRRA